MMISKLASIDCLLQAYSLYDGDLHQSWLLPNGHVVSYEYLGGSEEGSICTWQDLDSYVEALADVWWLNEPEFIVQCAPELEAYGFPFIDEEEMDGLE